MIVAQVKFNEFDFFFFELNNAHDQKIQLQIINDFLVRDGRIIKQKNQIKMFLRNKKSLKNCTFFRFLPTMKEQVV